MTLRWIPIAISGLTFAFDAYNTVGALSMDGSRIVATGANVDDASEALFEISVTPPPGASATNVRFTVESYTTTDDFANGNIYGPAVLALQGNEAAPFPSATWTLPTGPQNSFLPASIEINLDPGEVANKFQSTDTGDDIPMPETFSILVEVELEDTNYNCDCDDENNNQTLAQLRTRITRRIGASGMTAAPGPGMSELIDDLLQSSQEMLYREYDVLRTLRFFTWNLRQGVRFYDLADNVDECVRKWDPRKVVWVGISGADEWWQPLRCGIPPEFYSWNSVQGWPQLYEVRQCIEIWPAPDSQAWKLRIKGDFGLEPFAADGDKTTIDSEAVFLHALARIKAHLQQPDAANYERDCLRYIGNLTAGAHQTRRYIPGAVLEPNAIPPVWLPLNGGPP